jgi:hypothetical protein
MWKIISIKSNRYPPGDFFERYPWRGIDDSLPVFILANHSPIHSAGELEYNKHIAENGLPVYRITV